MVASIANAPLGGEGAGSVSGAAGKGSGLYGNEEDLWELLHFDADTCKACRCGTLDESSQGAQAIH